MLTIEENEMLSRVGAGTSMGNLMRRYWHPIAPAGELSEPPTNKKRYVEFKAVTFEIA